MRLSSFDTSGSVFVYASNSPEDFVGPYSGDGPTGGGNFWTDIVHSEAVTIAYLGPAGTDAVPEPPFRVTAISHFARWPLPREKARPHPRTLPLVPEPRSIAGCHLDASCFPDWLDRTYRSTALVLITNGTGTHSCSGTLINTRYETDEHLLMLTAGHCVETQDEAASAVFVWNSETTECYGQAISPSGWAASRGAMLVASRNDRRADFTLLRLDQGAVLEVTGISRLGWSPNALATGTEVVAISHPGGAYKRVGFGEITRVRWAGKSSASFSGIRWSHGTTEPGSSGAGVRREGDGRLVGLITGGSADTAACDRDYRSAINFFSVIYDEIKRYLDSESALSSLLPKPISIPLGSTGESLTLTPDPDGSYRMGDTAVYDGSLVTANNGAKYRLRFLGDGSWSAEYVKTTSEIPLLGGAESLSIIRAEDGSHWVGDITVADGAGVTHALHGTYQLRLDRSSGAWRAEPIPVGVPLSAGGWRLETLAGTGRYGSGKDGGPARHTDLANPSGVAFDANGNVVLVDSENHRVRRVSRAGTIETIAGSGNAGFSGDGGPATEAQLRDPRGVAVAPSGAVYVADTGNNRVRVVRSDGTIDTVAGGAGPGSGSVGGRAIEAQLAEPHGVALDQHGSLYIADSGNHRILKVALGVVSVVAGSGGFGFGGDAGPAHLATMRFPRGVTVDEAGIVYVADSGNHRIRRVGLDARIVTVMGTGQRGASGDGGPAADAEITLPRAVMAAPDGSIYVADSGNHALRQLRSDGIAFAVAPTEFEGSLSNPTGIAADGDGALVVADPRSRRVWRIRPDWTFVAPEALPSPELVPLGDQGDWARIWRTSDSKYFYKGSPIRSGDIVFGWSGEAYRLEHSAISGWLADPTQIDFSTDFQSNRREALRGDAVAQGRLGLQYLRGLGVDKDHAEALSWFQRAATQGDDLAQFWLGRMHDLGNGVSQNAAKAVDWYRLAARQGNADAQYRLGRSYGEGRGVPEDRRKASLWFHRAAMRDDSRAQAALAYIFSDEESAAHSPVQAFHWYRLSALMGNPYGQVKLGIAYREGHGVDISNAEAVKWIRLGAERGSSWGQVQLGWMYEFGKAVARSNVEAVRWYRLAAVQASGYAQWRLGSAFMNGEGLPRDDIAALVWLALAQSNGESRAEDDWETVRARLAPDQLRRAHELGARCTESDYGDCP